MHTTTGEHNVPNMNRLAWFCDVPVFLSGLYYDVFKCPQKEHTCKPPSFSIFRKIPGKNLPSWHSDAVNHGSGTLPRCTQQGVGCWEPTPRRGTHVTEIDDRYTYAAAVAGVKAFEAEGR